MKNIVKYAETQMNTFDKLPFNQVDSIILSQLSYIHYEKIFPSPGKNKRGIDFLHLLKAENYPGMFNNVRDPQNNKKLMLAVAASPRFRHMRVSDYVTIVDSIKVKQFGAVAFSLPDNTSYIAFRGTDSTFTGWKEDFNMAFETPVSAQIESVAYLNKIAPHLKGALRIGGHSKGGNLAVYSSMKCKRHIQDRITVIYNHDGPGFKEEIFTSPGYKKIKNIILKTIPQSAIIGMLLENHGDFSIVESNKMGLTQHDPFSWRVENNDFLYAKTTTKSSDLFNSSVNQWISSATDEKRELFINSIFRIIKASGVNSFSEFSSSRLKSAVTSLGEVKNIDPETRKFISKTIAELVSISMKNIGKASLRKFNQRKLKSSEI